MKNWNNNILKNVLVAMIVSAEFVELICGCTIVKGYRVHVVNSLPDNSNLLNVHCKSKNDDLGVHTFGVGQQYSFHFCESFFKNTLFACHLQWGTRSVGFEGFSSKGPNDCPSGNCFWVAKSDGIYYGDIDPISLTKKYDWQY